MKTSARLRRALLIVGVGAATCIATARAQSGAAKAWPERIPAPTGMEESPGPWNDSDDATHWPNRTSRANSDTWIAEHHDTITQMRPRVLLVNYSNAHSREHLERLANQIIACLAESSRYHGYKDPAAPVFLQYEVFGFVDLRDEDRTAGNSRLFPYADRARKSGFNTRYRAFFEDEFARQVGIDDPREPGRKLRLDELVDGGYVHEVWFFTSGAQNPEDPVDGAYEVVELKPVYDEAFHKVGADRFVQAGNGGDRDQPWTGRSVRIGCINASRGPGCFLESLAHGVEGNSNSGAIPYFTRYFREYAGLDLRERLGLPFESLYAVNYGEKGIRYPDARTMVVPHRGRDITVKDYVAFGGNAHFPPNARGHYDLDNPEPVNSTIEDWRIGSGPGGKDLSKPWTIDAFRPYREIAGDCMGPWLVYWRQNMPGLDNKQKDDAGKPMKNWWPFLFY